MCYASIIIIKLLGVLIFHQIKLPYFSYCYSLKMYACKLRKCRILLTNIFVCRAIMTSELFANHVPSILKTTVSTYKISGY